MDDFAFLGHLLIVSNGGASAQIGRLLAMAGKAMLNLEDIWKDRSIEEKRKIKLVRALVFLIARYDSEMWPLRQVDEKKSDSFELWCYGRRFFNRQSWANIRVGLNTSSHPMLPF